MKITLIRNDYNRPKSYNKAKNKDLNLRYNSWLRTNEKMTKKGSENLQNLHKIPPINLLHAKFDALLNLPSREIVFLSTRLQKLNVENY